MTFSYDKFIEYINNKGMTPHDLRKNKVITDYAARKLGNNESMQLEHIVAICLYFGLELHDVVEIIRD